MNTEPFFIVGVQRSGTTLLRLILNAHSEIAIPEEASFLKPLLKSSWIRQTITNQKREKVISYLENNEQFKLWNFNREPFFKEIAQKKPTSLTEIIEAMYSSYASFEGKPRWGDKSLFFGKIELLHEMFPNALFIHIVRDGRDVFDSWRKMDTNKSHPTVMALDWKTKIKFIEKATKNIPAENMLVVRYEDLLSHPEIALKDICNFLNIEFEEKMLAFHQSSNKYIGKHHSDLIFKPIDDSNTNKWKKRLTAKETIMYQMLAGKILNKYKYELSPKKPGIDHYLYVLVDLLIGLPKRFFELIQVRLAFRRAIKRGEPTKRIVGEMPSESN